MHLLEVSVLHFLRNPLKGKYLTIHLCCKIQRLKTFLNQMTDKTNFYIHWDFPNFGFTLISNTMWTVCDIAEPSKRSLAFVLQRPEAPGSLPQPPSLRKRSPSAWENTLGYYRVFMVPSCVVRPKRRPRVKASCKIYVHAAVTVGGKINIAGLMHGDDWVLSDWQ